LDLTTLINAYRGPLIGLIASWGAPWSDATEIAQDSFAEAWLNRDSCRGDWRDIEIFGRWLRGVAKNQFRNWSRSRRRRTARLADPSATNLEQLPTSEEAETTEQIEALREAIERLSVEQRQVVFMHYLEETSVQEIATLLGTSLKTVEGRLYQARLSLRRLLTEKHTAAQIGMLLLCL
jgi:RNA polymerase sigma factor (sigma-70 family)